MKTFKDFINEAVNPDDYEDRASKKSSLFLGRTQPPHLGHKKIIDMMTNPFMALVKGAKSSQDKARNPFDEKYQYKLLKMISPKINILTAKSGYIPDIVNEIRKSGYEIIAVYAGDDRINGYKKQIESFNKQMPTEKQINVEFHKTPRITSATAVRNSIKNDDLTAFKKIMPKQLWGEFETMKKKMGVK